MKAQTKQFLQQKPNLPAWKLCLTLPMQVAYYDGTISRVLHLYEIAFVLMRSDRKHLRYCYNR